MNNTEYYRHLIDLTGLSQREVASELGISEGRFRAALRGKGELSRLEVLALERFVMPDEVYQTVLNKWAGLMNPEPTTHHRPRMLNSEQLETLKQLYSSGVRVDDIATQLNVSKPTIVRRLREMVSLGMVVRRR